MRIFLFLMVFCSLAFADIQAIRENLTDGQKGFTNLKPSEQAELVNYFRWTKGEGIPDEKRGLLSGIWLILNPQAEDAIEEHNANSKLRIEPRTTLDNKRVIPSDILTDGYEPGNTYYHLAPVLMPLKMIELTSTNFPTPPSLP